MNLETRNCLVNKTAARQSDPHQIILTNLWNGASDDLGVWAILDAQWTPNLVENLIRLDLEYCSLFEGPLTSDRLYHSPILVRLEQQHPFTDWLLSEGWGKGWGIYFQASATRAVELYPQSPASHIEKRRRNGEFFGSPDLENGDEQTTLLLRKHFRRFTRVQFEDDGRIVIFRFFDPGVLRTFLSSCTSAELETFFGPIRFFVTEHFSEVESLSQRDEMLLWSTRRLALEDRHSTELRQHSLNLQTYEVGVVNYPPMFDRTSDARKRSSSGHFVIRKEQSQVFRAQQIAQFEEEVAQTLLESEFQGSPNTLQSARDAARIHVVRARAMGLSTRGDIANFVICSSIYGPDFPDRQPIAAEKFLSLQRSVRSGTEESILSNCLASWAQGGDITRG